MFTKGFHTADPFDRRVEEMTNKTPPTMVVDSQPKIGPWSKNNNLGIEQHFAPDANNRQTILKMPEWGFPQLWTISLSISPLNIVNLALFNGRNIKAIIEFGVGGTTQTINVDWKVGTQISVVTNSINVIAEFANIDVTTSENDFKLSVQVGRGNRSNSIPPISTLVVSPFATGALAPGTIAEAVTLGPLQDSGLLTLPPFAARLGVAPATLDVTNPAQFYSADTLIELLSGTGLGTTTVALYRGSDLLALGGSIPITGSAIFARILNIDVADSVDFTAWVELAA